MRWIGSGVFLREEFGGQRVIRVSSRRGMCKGHYAILSSQWFPHIPSSSLKERSNFTEEEHLNDH